MQCPIAMPSGNDSKIQTVAKTATPGGSASSITAISATKSGKHINRRLIERPAGGGI
jgi:hypothetical protein